MSMYQVWLFFFYYFFQIKDVQIFYRYKPNMKLFQFISNWSIRADIYKLNIRFFNALIIWQTTFSAPENLLLDSKCITFIIHILLFCYTKFLFSKIKRRFHSALTLVKNFSCLTTHIKACFFHLRKSASSFPFQCIFHILYPVFYSSI